MQGMRELLRGSLGRSLSGLTPMDRLAAAWPVACGRSMAEHGVVREFAEGRVVIEVKDAAWLLQMRAMSGQLLGELRRIAAVAELREIHFEQGGPVRRGPATTRPAAPRDGPGRPKGRSR